jgi:hypothetical protein
MKKLSSIIFVAGLCGGIAEIVWVALYSTVSSTHALEVAQQVSASVLPSLTNPSLMVAMGISIHLILSILLAWGFVMMVWKPVGQKLTFMPAMLLAIATLSVIWACNFFLVLPRLNPAFIVLMPYKVTFFSKMLFALAMGLGLTYMGAHQEKVVHLPHIATT